MDRYMSIEKFKKYIIMIYTIEVFPRCKQVHLIVHHNFKQKINKTESKHLRYGYKCTIDNVSRLFVILNRFTSTLTFQ